MDRKKMLDRTSGEECDAGSGREGRGGEREREPERQSG